MDTLPKDKVQSLFGAFDVIGDIAIIKIPEGLENFENEIAKAVLHGSGGIHTVLKQSAPVSGDYRLRALEFLAGEEKYETVHKEYGSRFVIDVRKAYFSPRLSTERSRICKLVRDGEIVVNMFGGVGTFSVRIAAKNQSVLVYNIDANPSAIRYSIRNCELNKVSNRVINLCGDAREIIPSYHLLGIANRVLMPLPERSKEFIPSAYECLKEGKGVIHYYTHLRDEGNPEVLREGVLTQVREGLDPIRGNFVIEDIHVVREVGPRYFQVAADLVFR
jgi:tRNA (guanine37-N1)-methyltransferase